MGRFARKPAKAGRGGGGKRGSKPTEFWLPRPRISRALLGATSALCGTLANPWTLVSLGAGSLVLTPLPAGALPQGGTVVQGQAQIIQVSPAELKIIQSTDKVIIDWQSFNIATGQTVNFVQNSALAQALNRVLGGGASSINGNLNANGQVVLSNAAGVHMGTLARVDVNSIVITAANIANRDFMAGNLTFGTAGNPTASVTNDGIITIGAGGLVALVAPGVANNGIINARLGKVALASGNSFTLDLYGDKLIQFAVNDKVMQAATGATGEQMTTLVNNSGKIEADGGVVQITANAARGVVANVINTSGLVQARAVASVGGEIILDGGDAGTVMASGSGIIDVSGKGANQKGGQVAMLGQNVGLTDAALIDASGSAGGGTVNMGGSRQGMGPLPNSEALYIAPDAAIDASATRTGNGGTIITYSDKSTKIYGQLSARGGADGGNGGFIETSGKQALDVGRAPDASAPAGHAGEWLIDPANIQIIAGAGCTNINCVTDPWAPTADSATIGVSTILAGLGAGNVTITTAGAGSQAGNITFQSGANIAKTTGATDVTLTLNANGNIDTTGATIAASGTSGRLGVTLNAAGDVGVNSAITTRGGNFSAAGGTVTASSAGVVNTTGNTGQAGGTVSITSAGAVSLAGGITTTGGTAATTSAGQKGGDITILGGTISTAGLTAAGSAAAASSAAAGGSGGAIGLTASSVAVGAISTLGGAANGTGNGGTGGALTVDAGAGTATFNSTVSTAGGTGQTGGNISITAGGLVTLSNTVSAIGGAGSTGNAGKNAGSVTINGGDITTASVATITTTGGLGGASNTNGGAGGAINLNATDGTPTITLGATLSAAGGAGNGTGNGGAGGAITLNDPAVLTANVALNSLNGTGGTPSAGGAIQTASIDGDGTARRTLTINSGGAVATLGTVNVGALGATTALSTVSR